MLTISSPDFRNNGTIPAKFTGDGRGISPAIEWSNVPAKTESFALILEDPDAPSGLFIHWVIFNIPSGRKGLPEAVPNTPKLEDGSLQGENSAGSIGYYGPFPPAGPPHRYQFRLYALNRTINAKPGAGRKQVIEAMQEHVIESTCLTGIYQRGHR
jgi:Raf kinase inhibitor-like YbhB/YbcL family protein